MCKEVENFWASKTVLEVLQLWQVETWLRKVSAKCQSCLCKVNHSSCIGDKVTGFAIFSNAFTGIWVEAAWRSRTVDGIHPISGVVGSRSDSLFVVIISFKLVSTRNWRTPSSSMKISLTLTKEVRPELEYKSVSPTWYHEHAFSFDISKSWVITCVSWSGMVWESDAWWYSPGNQQHVSREMTNWILH